MTEFKPRENIQLRGSAQSDRRVNQQVTGEVKEQEIYLGDYPWMTRRGTFVINGAERCRCVATYPHSGGVFFMTNTERRLVRCKVIPGRGAWLEFKRPANGALYVKIDRKRKIPVLTLLQGLGLNEARMKESFKHVDTGKVSYLEATLEKDPARGTNDADQGCSPACTQVT